MSLYTLTSLKNNYVGGYTYNVTSFHLHVIGTAGAEAMKKVLFFLAVFLLASLSYQSGGYKYNESSEMVMMQDGRISGMKNRYGKDIVIGGMVRIHDSENGKCTDKIIEHKSVENLEAMLYAIDKINNDSSLLANLTIGYDIRDTCVSQSVALDEAIDIIHTNGQIELESCSELNNETELMEPPVSAVIGPIISSVTTYVAGLFRLFTMPQVSFSSTSTLLNNREFYPYFFRTISSDKKQVQAIIDIIRHFHWNHVSTIYSSNNYGQPAIDKFHKLAEQEGICIDIREGLSEDFQPDQYDEVAMKLNNSEANVVVLFASLPGVKGVLDALTRMDKPKQFLWLAGDSWSELKAYSDITMGKWGTAPSASFLPDLNEYFQQLTPDSNKRNPWFSDFYSNCNNGDHGNCNKSLAKNSQDSFDALAIDAVYTIASAFDTFLKENCDIPLVWYPQNKSCITNSKNFTTLTGEMLAKYISMTNTTSITENIINFDSEGNVAGSYDVLNFQRNTSSDCTEPCYNTIKVGAWKNNQLTLFNNVEQQFGIDKSTGKPLTSIHSNCQRCPSGHIKRKVISSCCGTCDPCLGQYFTNSTLSVTCTACPDKMWGNNPLSGSSNCIDINESYLNPSNPWGVVLILFALVGL